MRVTKKRGAVWTFNAPWICLLALLLVSRTEAQPQESSFLLWTFSTPQGIALGWSLPHDHPLPSVWQIMRRIAGETVYQPIGVQRLLPFDQWDTQIRRHPGADTLQQLIAEAQRQDLPDSVRYLIIDLLNTALLIDFPLLHRVFGTVWMDSTVQRGVAYDYAIEVAGQIIGEVRSVRWDGERLPLPPSGLEAEPADSNHIRLRWDIRAARANGIWGYIVERRREDQKTWEQLTQEPVRALLLNPDLPIQYLYLDTGLTLGTQYWYRVRSVDLLSRTSPPSDSVIVAAMDARPLIPPFAVIATTIGGRVFVRWHPSPDARVVGYNLYRWEWAKEDQKQRMNAQPIRDTFFVDQPQTSAEYIVYAVTAVDQYGRESNFSLPHAVPQPDTIPPAPPTNIEATPAVGTITLRWQPSKSQDAYAYEVVRSIDPQRGEFTLVSDSLLTDTTFVDRLPVEAGRTTFWYRVRTVDRAGNRSRWSVPIAVRLPDVVPPHPPWIIGVQARPNALIIRWQPPYDPDLYGYLLFRYQDTTLPPLRLTQQPLPKNTTVYIDSTVLPGQTYWYTLAALDSAGNLSAFAPRVQGHTYLHTPPPPPVIDSVAVEPNAVTLFFSYPYKSPPIHSFLVERSVDGRRFVPISPLLSPQTRHFVDRAILCQPVCYYRVRARSLSGAYSLPSKVRKVVLP